MFTALLTCSDEDCLEAVAFDGTLAEAEIVLCDGCGCLMQVVGIEGGHDEAEVIDLGDRRDRRSGARRRVAA